MAAAEDAAPSSSSPSSWSPPAGVSSPGPHVPPQSVMDALHRPDAVRPLFPPLNASSDPPSLPSSSHPTQHQTWRPRSASQSGESELGASYEQSEDTWQQQQQLRQQPIGKRQRGSYKCRRCGQPKKGHTCPLESSSSPHTPIHHHQHQHRQHPRQLHHLDDAAGHGGPRGSMVMTMAMSSAADISPRNPQQQQQRFVMGRPSPLSAREPQVGDSPQGLEISPGPQTLPRRQLAVSPGDGATWQPRRVQGSGSRSVAAQGVKVEQDEQERVDEEEEEDDEVEEEEEDGEGEEGEDGVEACEQREGQVAELRRRLRMVSAVSPTTTGYSMEGMSFYRGGRERLDAGEGRRKEESRRWLARSPSQRGMQQAGRPVSVGVTPIKGVPSIPQCTPESSERKHLPRFDRTEPSSRAPTPIKKRSPQDLCMLIILSKLPPQDLLSATACCRRWRRLATEIWNDVKEATFVLSESPCPSRYLSFMLMRCPCLVRLTLKMQTTVDDDLLRGIVANRTHLSSLKILKGRANVPCAITGAGVADLTQGCPKLEILEVDGCDQLVELTVRSASLQRISLSSCHRLASADLDCPSLREISLDALDPGAERVVDLQLGCQVAAIESPKTASDLSLVLQQVAASCPALEKVHVASPQLTNADVRALLSGPHNNMRALSLTLAPLLTDESAREIVDRCALMQLVDMSGCCGLAERTLQYLSATFSESLTHLFLAACPNMTPGAVRTAVAALPRLKLLDLGHSLVARPEERESGGGREGGGPGRREAEGEGEKLQKVKEESPAEEGGEGRLAAGGGEGGLTIRRRRRSLSRKGSGRGGVAKGEERREREALSERMLQLQSGSLERLSLWGCTRLQGVELNCPSLLELNLNFCVNLEPSPLALDFQCARLHHLSTFGCSAQVIDYLHRAPWGLPPPSPSRSPSPSPSPSPSVSPAPSPSLSVRPPFSEIQPPARLRGRRSRSMRSPVKARPEQS